MGTIVGAVYAAGVGILVPHTTALSLAVSWRTPSARSPMRQQSIQVFAWPPLPEPQEASSTACTSGWVV
jgi:hypothetical protein